MNSGANPKPIRSGLLTILLLVAIVGLLAAIATPNFVGGGPSKMGGVINMLRQIDGAKYEWAFEHGLTNTASFSHQVSQEDIASLLKRQNDRITYSGFGFDRNGNIHSAQGVVFAINPLGMSPEVKFTKAFKLSDRSGFFGPRIPKGTVMRFSTNADGFVEYILPGQESKPCKSLTDLLAR